jgi:hypothetical protein
MSESRRQADRPRTIPPEMFRRTASRVLRAVPVPSEGTIRPAAYVVGLGALLLAYWWFDDKRQTFPSDAQGAFTVWALLIAGLSGILGVLFLPLWHWFRKVVGEGFTKRWLDASGESRVWKMIELSLVAILFLGALALPSLVGVRVTDHPFVAPWRESLWLWILLASAAVLPAVLGLLALQRSADVAEWEDNSNTDCGDLFLARSHLRRFLTALGGVVGLAVLSAGALQRAIEAGDPDTTFTSDLVIAYGALLTGLLLSLYLPAHLSIERRASRLRDELNKPSDSTDTGSWLKKRQELNGVMEIKGISMDSLEQAILILAPLLSAAVGTFLGSE